MCNGFALFENKKQLFQLGPCWRGYQGDRSATVGAVINQKIPSSPNTWW